MIDENIFEGEGEEEFANFFEMQVPQVQSDLCPDNDSESTSSDEDEEQLKQIIIEWKIHEKKIQRRKKQFSFLVKH